jgi:hypothetical protein
VAGVVVEDDIEQAVRIEVAAGKAEGGDGGQVMCDGGVGAVSAVQKDDEIE